MTQEQLARTVGRSRSAALRWETKSASARPPHATVVPLIAKALGIPEEDLYEEVPPPAA